MPILKEVQTPDGLPPADWVDPDHIPRHLVTIGINMKLAGRLELEPHTHEKAQFILCLRGVLTCEAEGGFWLVPPNSAIWIPPAMMHAIRAEGTLEGYAAFIDPAVVAGLPNACRTFSSTPLLREMLVRTASFPVLYPEDGFEARLMALLIEEIAAAPMGNIHLPMPSDERLRKIIDMMMRAPGDRATIAVWAKRAGLSERTLSRLVADQTGMSFGRWRQQLNIMLALQELAKGRSIQQVAADLGYENSSFMTMFRKALGVAPGAYMNRHAVR
jgi:AraC-like DNA-binding protein/quercetin dioxygenase-like cupin family protein